MALLRHDFRRVYGCSYDEVPADEAIDLVRTLPDGSLYVAATDPARSWSEARSLSADLEDRIYQVMAMLAGMSTADAPSVVRPQTLAASRKAKGRASAARKRIEDTDWEEA